MMNMSLFLWFYEVKNSVSSKIVVISRVSLFNLSIYRGCTVPKYKLAEYPITYEFLKMIIALKVLVFCETHTLKTLPEKEIL